MKSYEYWSKKYDEAFGYPNAKINNGVKMVAKKKRGRKPGVKVGPYKSRFASIAPNFDLNEYLSPATMRYIVRDIKNSIQQLNAKSKIIERHLNQLKSV